MMSNYNVKTHYYEFVEKSYNSGYKSKRAKSASKYSGKPSRYLVSW